ncbi:ABC transporter permease [soil metagenome]
MIRTLKRSTPARAPRRFDRVLSWRLWDHLAAVLLVLLFWALVARSQPSYLFPAPWVVLPKLGTRLLEPQFLAELGRSLARLSVGYAVAVAAGLLSTLVAAVSVPAKRVLTALFGMLQNVPPIAYIPLLILLLGFGDKPVGVVIALAAFFPLAVGGLNALKHVEARHLEVAQTLQASRVLTLRRVVLPALAPQLVGAARIAFGNAWRGLVAAEMIAGVGQGVGWTIAQSGQVGDMAGVLLGILAVGVVAAVVDVWLFATVERRLFAWKTP